MKVNSVVSAGHSVMLGALLLCSGQAFADDPWESANVHIFAFNKFLDGWLLQLLSDEEVALSPLLLELYLIEAAV